MKKFSLLLSCLMLAYSGIAQDSWKIVLHKKVLLTSSEMNESVNVRTIRSTDWRKKGYLEIQYKEGQKSSFRHSIRLTDENGIELFVKDSVRSIKIATSTLRRLFAGKKQLKIYMVLSPGNPMMGMPSRMIHLATLKLP